jgi:hypothetical protein
VIKRELNIRLIYECRFDERLNANAEVSTRLTDTLQFFYRSKSAKGVRNTPPSPIFSALLELGGIRIIYSEKPGRLQRDKGIQDRVRSKI